MATKNWMMFLDDFENLPKSLVKNVKYVIQREDSFCYQVMGIKFQKPLKNIEIGEILSPFIKDG